MRKSAPSTAVGLSSPPACGDVPGMPMSKKKGVTLAAPFGAYGCADAADAADDAGAALWAGVRAGREAGCTLAGLSKSA